MSGGSRAKLIWSDKKSCLAIKSNLPELLKAETIRDLPFNILIYLLFIKIYLLGYLVVSQTKLCSHCVRNESYDNKQIHLNTSTIIYMADYWTHLTTAHNPFKSTPKTCDRAYNHIPAED